METTEQMIDGDRIAQITKDPEAGTLSAGYKTPEAQEPSSKVSILSKAKHAIKEFTDGILGARSPLKSESANPIDQRRAELRGTAVGGTKNITRP